MRTGQRIAALLVGVVVLAAVATATRVRQCDSKKEYVDDPNIVIGGCDKLPCRLKRGKNIKVEMNFKTETGEVPVVKNQVAAMIVGIPFPFIGVDGKSTCGKIFEKGADTQAACPLASGKEYTYKDSFDVLQIYPRLKTVVRWAIKAGNSTLLCFNVPVRIV